VDKCLLFFTPYFGPDVVRPIVDKSSIDTERAATKREALRPLSAPTTPSVQQLAGVVISVIVSNQTQTNKQNKTKQNKTKQNKIKQKSVILLNFK
jgi:hypothetical protein